MAPRCDLAWARPGGVVGTGSREDSVTGAWPSGQGQSQDAAQQQGETRQTSVGCELQIGEQWEGRLGRKGWDQT